MNWFFLQARHQHILWHAKQAYYGMLYGQKRGTDYVHDLKLMYQMGNEL